AHGYLHHVRGLPLEDDAPFPRSGPRASLARLGAAATIDRPESPILNLNARLGKLFLSHSDRTALKFDLSAQLGPHSPAEWTPLREVEFRLLELPLGPS